MWDGVVMFIGLCVLTYLVKKILSSEPNIIQFNFKFIALYLMTSVYAFVVWPYFLLNPRNVKNLVTASRTLKHMTKLYDLKWELRHGEILSKDQGAVIISNHQSALDILGMFNIWELCGKMTVIAKKELFYVWPFGLAAYLCGVVFIDRKNAKGAYKQLDVTSEVMVKNKTKVWLFAEGTRNKDYTKLQPFKKGAFNMAVRAQVPLIPVLFSPYYFVNPKKHIFNKGHIIIKCLEPVKTVGLTVDDVPALMERVHATMQRSYIELSKEVLHDLPNDYPHTTVRRVSDRSENGRGRMPASAGTSFRTSCRLRVMPTSACRFPHSVPTPYEHW